MLKSKCGGKKRAETEPQQSSAIHKKIGDTYSGLKLPLCLFCVST